MRGIIIKCHQGLAAGTIAEFSKALKVRRSVMWHATLSQPIFLTERTDIQNIATTFESSDFWGNWPNDVRFPPKLRMQRMLILKSHSDFSNQKDIFHSSVDLFNSPDDEVRGAAAFAAGEILAQKRQLQRILKLNLGNIAVGNLHLFLPVIVKLVQTDKDKRLPALHALKEVVSNCPSGQLEAVAETIWVPLFQDSANSEEATRNIAAACLGKLTTTNPSRYLPQLQVRIVINSVPVVN